MTKTVLVTGGTGWRDGHLWPPDRGIPQAGGVARLALRQTYCPGSLPACLPGSDEVEQVDEHRDIQGEIVANDDAGQSFKRESEDDCCGDGN